MPSNGMGMWSQAGSQIGLGVTIADPLAPQTVVNGLEPGNLYSFRWTITGSCGSFFDDVIIQVSDPDPFAGFDQLVCSNQATVELEADFPLNGSKGRWATTNADIAIQDEDEPITIATNLSEGINTFIWTIDDGICGNISTDTVLIEYTPPPDAVDDEVTVNFNESADFDVLSNDFFVKTASVQILSGPAVGTLQMNDEGKFAYTAPLKFIGQDELVYELCSDGCECSTATVFFRVGGDATCEVPTIFTPNEDGVNDEFVIPCLLNIDRYPASQVIIYNRWGDEVFRSPKPYKNNWRGTFNGEDLPAGTYFYFIDFGDGNKPINGYTMIYR